MKTSISCDLCASVYSVYVIPLFSSSLQLLSRSSWSFFIFFLSFFLFLSSLNLAMLHFPHSNFPTRPDVLIYFWRLERHHPCSQRSGCTAEVYITHSEEPKVVSTLCLISLVQMGLKTTASVTQCKKPECSCVLLHLQTHWKNVRKISDSALLQRAIDSLCQAFNNILHINGCV